MRETVLYSICGHLQQLYGFFGGWGRGGEGAAVIRLVIQRHLHYSRKHLEVWLVQL